MGRAGSALSPRTCLCLGIFETERQGGCLLICCHVHLCVRLRWVGSVHCLIPRWGEEMPGAVILVAPHICSWGNGGLEGSEYLAKVTW